MRSSALRAAPNFGGRSALFYVSCMKTRLLYLPVLL